jgi:hypothetical protein
MSRATGNGKASAGKPAKLTFDELAELEPGLADLEDDIRETRQQTPPWKARFRLWYWEFKPRLLKLVGWCTAHSRDGVLGSREAYDVAYHHLHDLLIRRGTTGRRRRSAD